MDLGGVNRPPVPAAPPRLDAMATAGAVKTELPQEASVQAVGEAPAVTFENRDGTQARARLDAAVREMIDRNTLIDPKTREVVYQSVDRKTGEVVRQVPDEMLLRLRAYAREMREADTRRDDAPQVQKLA
jgi:flagellar protein FlaG